MGKELLVLTIIVIIFLLFFIEQLLTKTKIKNKNEHGSARFSTIKEIKQNFKKELVNGIKRLGFPIFFDSNLSNVWVDTITPHWVYLGSTGSGKSKTQVIPFCTFLSTTKEKRSAFITDPKGEIFNKTSKMFKERGFNVITLDFRNPELSNKYNILKPIIDEYKIYLKCKKLSEESNIKKAKQIFNNISMSSYSEVMRQISSLSGMIMSEKESKDPFWINSAKQLLEGLIGFFLEEYRDGNISENQITMTSIRKFQNSLSNKDNFDKFKEYLESKEYGFMSKDYLLSIISSAENTCKSIFSVWSEKMNIFDDINVGNIISTTDIDLKIIGEEKTIIYVIVPDEDKAYYPLVSIIVGTLYKELVKLTSRLEKKELPYKIDWILDEFANCPPFNDIESMVSVSRSRGMRFHFFIQSFSQLYNVYGKEVSKIILDNSGLIYLKTNTQDTAEEISKRLGKKTIESFSISESINSSKYNGNKSTSLIARDLMTPDEIKQLHYKMIIFPTVGYPIIRDTILYDKFDNYKDGYIERNTNSIHDLKDTYYTVEKLKYKSSIEKFNEANNSTASEFNKENIEYQRNKFNEAIEITKNILEDEKYNINFSECNNKLFVVVNLNKKLNNRKILLLKSNMSNRGYHIEFNERKIEIHSI